MKVVGKRADRLHDRRRIPPRFPLEALPFDGLAREEVGEADGEWHSGGG